jgi:uncharacterized small protein (DUF1192 family)
MPDDTDALHAEIGRLRAELRGLVDENHLLTERLGFLAQEMERLRAMVPRRSSTS